MVKCGYPVNAIICIQESDDQGTNTYPVHVARVPGHFIGHAAHTSGMKGQQLCATVPTAAPPLLPPPRLAKLSYLNHLVLYLSVSVFPSIARTPIIHGFNDDSSWICLCGYDIFLFLNLYMERIFCFV